MRAVEVIAGISLPMLLRAITYRRDTLDVVVEMALAGAQSGAVRVDNRIRVAARPEPCPPGCINAHSD
jgi:PTS system ascorbate-specific IIA component